MGYLTKQKLESFGNKDNNSKNEIPVETGDRLFISPFNNKNWRKMLNEIIKEIDAGKIGLEIISPFGFELLEKKEFLNGSLRRFYCYIGIPKVRSNISTEICECFSQKLLKIIRNNNQKDYDDIAIIVKQDNFTKLNNIGQDGLHNKKLIDIQCRSVSTSIMEDYCNYVICSLSAILHGKDEPKFYEFNKRFRVRTYQLYIMLESIFGHLLRKKDTMQQNLSQKIVKRIDNSIDIFFDSKKLLMPADEEDLQIMNYLIKPRTSEMVTAIRSDQEIEISCTSFHVEDMLNIKICKKIYGQAVRKIVKTYYDFG